LDENIVNQNDELPAAFLGNHLKQLKINNLSWKNESFKNRTIASRKKNKQI
jgi:hypothetical protein